MMKYGDRIVYLFCKNANHWIINHDVKEYREILNYALVLEYILGMIKKYIRVVMNGTKLRELGRILQKYKTKLWVNIRQRNNQREFSLLDKI